jgi:hypothetical protein
MTNDGAKVINYLLKPIKKALPYGRQAGMRFVIQI